jgi:hypothetical protein
MAQVGQRVGTAIGVAAIISTFYATLFSEGGRTTHLQVFRDAFFHGILVALGLVAISLVFALMDQFGGGEQTRRPPSRNRS